MRRLPSHVAGAILMVGIVATLRPESQNAPDNSAAAQSTLPAAAQPEIASVEAEINHIEASALARAAGPSLDPSQQLMLLGKLFFYDRNLSVERNEACAFCHMPETGFSGPLSALNQTTVSYPGSIRTRFSGRNPQHTLTPVSRPCFITTRRRETWWAALSGTCARPVCA